MKEGQNNWPSYTNDNGLNAASGVASNGASGTSNAADHFITRGDAEYAGTHIIADLWCDQGLDDITLVEQALREATLAAKATLLHIHLHHFTEGGGISGVAVLAESHISVHTWPERGFAAFDIFMCGGALPEAAIEVLKQTFRPHKTQVSTHLRGEVPRQV